MVEQRKRQVRRSGGRFYGFRVNCESVPCLLAWTVRRIWDDPRRIPYLLIWRGSHDGKVKEAVRIVRGVPGTIPGTSFPEAPFVEVKHTDGSIVNVYLVWRGQPHGGDSLLLRCLCGNACRALYGAKVGYGPRFYEVHRADWRCRTCAQLRYSSEGGHLRQSGRGAIAALFRAYLGNLPRPELWLPYVFTSIDDPCLDEILRPDHPLRAA